MSWCQGTWYSKPVDQTPAVYIEEPRIIHDSITVLQGPPAELEWPLPTPPPSEHPEEPEPEPVDPGISLQQSAMTTTNEPQDTESAIGASASQSTQRASGRANKGTITSTKFADETFDKKPGPVHMAKMARKTDPNDKDEPATVKEAINHPECGKQWEKAIRNKYESLIKNHTWDLVQRPRNRQIVTNKFAFKHKKDERARIVRLKARLMARGFSQIFGVDYLDTYAPVVKLASIRILLAIVAIFGLEIHQMDVVMAFLAGELEEEIYMEQPEGFEVGGKEDDLVCRLRKSIYGLKQAQRVWNQRIRYFLKSIGSDQLYSDSCIYINKTTDIIIAMWVDDLIIEKIWQISTLSRNS
jgi:hypothetical protein